MSQLENLFSTYQSIIVLDTETSGLSFTEDRIIELSAVKLVYENGEAKNVCEFDEFIKLPDGMSLDPKITELTGITEFQLFTEGLEESLACKRFADLFAEDKILIVAYNAQFDMNFLFYFLMRHNMTEILGKINMLDALTVYKDRRQYPHKLENAILEYGLSGKVVNSHRAIDDTLATVEVLKAMDDERSDLDRYINLFGYNPKFGVSGKKISSVKYVPQGYKRTVRLYDEI